MEVNESSTSFRSSDHEHVQGTCKSFGEKCSHVAKKQRAKFYILRRCIAMLHIQCDRIELSLKVFEEVSLK
ncbi:hypothetical protein RJ639_029520 [Escallonia herrerae]|uniref:Uncharacterized protein n=1 Tax=Escallonia herrerae TaxID=1293975 RepID=A0AA88RTS2_9ASTE|nr:hypothetical protein RJ639_029520 [Escallonia herrerae]